MSENRKFYWLKLKHDFFKRHDIRILEEMENGKDYILFYLKLLLESISHEGQLRFSEAIPYNEKMLSVITNTNIDIVRSAMKVLIELKMIEIFDDSTIYMSEVQKLIGCETAAAERKRRSRQILNALPKCDNVTNECDNVQKSHIEIEKEIDKEKDIEIEGIKSDKPTRTRFKPPTLDEVKAYCRERQNDVNPEKFIDHYTSNGWKVGKNPMKDWKAAVRTWERSEFKPQEKKTTGNVFLDILNSGEYDD